MLKSQTLYGDKLRTVWKWIVRTQKKELCSVCAVTASLGIPFPIHNSLNLCHLLGNVPRKCLVPKAVLCSPSTVGVTIFSCIAWVRNRWRQESAPIPSNKCWGVKTGEDVRLFKSLPTQLCWTCISWDLQNFGQHFWGAWLLFATLALAWPESEIQLSPWPGILTPRHLELQRTSVLRDQVWAKKLLWAWRWRDLLHILQVGRKKSSHEYQLYFQWIPERDFQTWSVRGEPLGGEGKNALLFFPGRFSLWSFIMMSLEKQQPAYVSAGSVTTGAPTQKKLWELLANLV